MFSPKLFLLVLFFLSNSLFAQSEIVSESWLQSLNRWIEAGISGSEFTFHSVILLVLGGLMASLLPCVYPLYPITVGIIQARGEAGRGKLFHPLVYYLGLSFMYFCFGLAAGISGGAVNTVLRYPSTNLFLAIIIFLLGLASLGYLHLPIFRSKEWKGGEGWKGTFFLGMGAGFLSSPCVGPVVVAILIQITAGIQAVTVSSLALSAFKMSLFGFGLGLPFLVLGVFGLSLPKSGKWTKWIQIVLGFVVLYFSWLYYSKAMQLWSIPSELSVGILAAAVGILLTAYFYQSNQVHRTERMRKALLLTGLICSSVIFIRLASGNSLGDFKKDVLEEHGNLEWHRASDPAFQLAKNQDRLVFVDFYADWCSNCKAFEELTLADPDLNQALGKTVLLKVKDDDKDFVIYEQDPRFPELKIGLPFFVIFSSDGRVLFKTTNYLNTADMIRTIRGENIHASGE
ncbi:protein-disulfide reductase DsbD family protein [Leptospira langatensis]|uniref:protein-disulfide reductase DsbD family protein n=1 Tax=Leptospira langatensis TaxID=2484983 RepID=UPI001FE6DAD3|nr:cytochrome c biogenesis protein CcdA [Leptospira langatensis]